jgi:two-component system, cell cycle response regulator DivK
MATILVVEDNPQNLKLTKVILEAAGHHVLVAPTASEAESVIAEQPPDLILMDLALPGKDGYTLTRELRGRAPTAKLPILAVSSFAMPGDAERALSAGCTAYLTKPIRRAILLERVDELLGTGVVSSPVPGPGSDGNPTPRPGPSGANPAAEPGPSSAPPEGIA